jgi:SAM-dependent methyltransferase
MSTAQVQGRLWGARVREYVTLVEEFFRPAFERVLDETGVGSGTRILDVGCGPGLAAELASRRGAGVAGLDAAEASIAIARERIPRGDFRVGDMEALPWPDGTFDVVTSFNGFQFAADIVRALREAKRVTRPGGRVAMLVWGRDDQCEVPRLMGALRDLLPPQPQSALPAIPLSVSGRIEALMAEAGLMPIGGGEVDATFRFTNLESALGGLLSAGAAVAIIQRVGDEPVRQTLTEALARFRTDDGGYVLANTFRYVIAAIT